MFNSTIFDWCQHYPQLASITDPAWVEAIQGMTPVAAPKNTQTYVKGDECQNFLLLIEGNIRIYASDRNGREIVLYRVRPGEFCILSLVCFLQGKVFPANAVTENRVRAMMIDRTTFHRTFENSPVFQKHMVSALSSRFFDIINRFQKLAFEPLDVRMANLLYSRFHEANSRSINTTHSQIAQELGTTREVASRMLKELERYGRITLSRA